MKLRTFYSNYFIINPNETKNIFLLIIALLKSFRILSHFCVFFSLTKLFSKSSNNLWEKGCLFPHHQIKKNYLSVWIADWFCIANFFVCFRCFSSFLLLSIFAADCAYFLFPVSQNIVILCSLKEEVLISCFLGWF